MLGVMFDDVKTLASGMLQSSSSVCEIHTEAVSSSSSVCLTTQHCPLRTIALNTGMHSSV